MRGLDRALTTDQAAVLAAQLASEAAAELLRFAREGEASAGATFEDEVVEKLAEAVFHALGIEGGPIFDEAFLPEEFRREAGLHAVLMNAAEAYVTEADCAAPPLFQPAERIVP